MAITTPASLLTPFRRELILEITQGPGGVTSHGGSLYYGWDFVTVGHNVLGQDVLAVANGTVEFILEDVPDGGNFAELPGPGETRDPSLGPVNPGVKRGQFAA